jgi:phosphoribosylanthranilate isomerase
MTHILVKICGLKTPEALDVALESGADLVGFVFFAPSPRHLGLEVARMLGARVQGRAGKVALTSSRRFSPTCCNCTAARRRSG